ncbi:FG-GAP repeat domain-containing protein [Nannocystis pusilla]|uniref:FG-GAP repeat domain-containing protein n=1 Tax=Nannocystis pusilla TaxID=889268 RepID=UPI003B76DEC9
MELRHRLRSIVTEVDGTLVRTTTLTYERSTMTPTSTLARIDTVAGDGAALPPWHLRYTSPYDEPRETTIAQAPALDPTADGRAWVDIDGDALPDLLDATLDVWRYRKGRGAALAVAWTDIPAPAVMLTKSARFADLTGDGVEDLLAQPGEGELWAFTGGDTPFGQAAPITLDLSFDLTATNVALVDLNLDGRVDVLRHDDTDGWIWLRNHDVPGYLPAEPVPRRPPACASAIRARSSRTSTAIACPTSCASCRARAASWSRQARVWGCSPSRSTSRGCRRWPRVSAGISPTSTATAPPTSCGSAAPRSTSTPTNTTARSPAPPASPGPTSSPTRS